MKKFLEEVKGISNSVTESVEEMLQTNNILLTYDCGSEEDAEHFQAKADMVFVKHDYPHFTSCLCLDPNYNEDNEDDEIDEEIWTVVDYQINIKDLKEEDKEKIKDIINDLDCI